MSFAAASDPSVHVGLGETLRADELIVRWMDGKLEAFGPFEADQAVSVRRDQGRAVEPR
jgi:hypothetical protein